MSEQAYGGLSATAVRDIFEDCGALQRGHFLLSSDRHSDEYWEKFWVLQWPCHIEALCEQIALKYRQKNISAVMGPTTGGILLAYEVARKLGVRAVYAEKENGARVLRRGLRMTPGEVVLIVDDIMTTGGAVKECIELAKQLKAQICGAAVLVNRSGGTVDLEYPLESLLTVNSKTYDAQSCPLCAQGLPLKKPGTSQ